MRGRDTSEHGGVTDSEASGDAKQANDAQQSGDKNQNKYPGSQNEENTLDKNDHNMKFLKSLEDIDPRSAEMLGWKSNRAGEESKDYKKEKLTDLDNWDRQKSLDHFAEAFRTADFAEDQLKDASMDVATTIFESSYGKAEQFQADNDEKYPKSVYDVLREEGIKDIQIDKDGTMFFEYKDDEQFKRIAEKTKKLGYTTREYTEAEMKDKNLKMAKVEAPDEEKRDEGWERTALVNENVKEFAEHLEKLGMRYQEQQAILRGNLSEQEKNDYVISTAQSYETVLELMDELLVNAESYANGNNELMRLGLEYEAMKELPKDQQKDRLERKANADWADAENAFHHTVGRNITDVEGFQAAKEAIQNSYIEQLQEGLAEDLGGKSAYTTHVTQMVKAAKDMEGAIMEGDGLVHRDNYTGMSVETPTNDNLKELLEDATQCMESLSPGDMDEKVADATRQLMNKLENNIEIILEYKEKPDQAVTESDLANQNAVNARMAEAAIQARGIQYILRSKNDEVPEEKAPSQSREAETREPAMAT